MPYLALEDAADAGRHVVARRESKGYSEPLTPPPNPVSSVRLAARDVRPGPPPVYATAVLDIYALLTVLDSAGLVALLAELQALEPARADNGG